jgi:WD40 repeat protein
MTLRSSVAGILLSAAACAGPPAPPNSPPPVAGPPVDLAGDPLPEGAVCRLGTRRFRVGGRVWAVAISKDGRTLYAGGGKSLLRWNLPDGKGRRSFNGHRGVVGSVALLPDPGLVMTADGVGLVALWDVDTGERIRDFNGHEGRAWSVAVSPDGTTALSAGMDGTLALWNIATGERIRSIPAHQGAALCAVFLGDGARALSGGADGIVAMWDLATGRRLKTLEGHRGEVCGLAVSPDGRLAVSASGQMTPDEGPERGDSTLAVWDLDSGRRVRSIEGTSGFLWVAFLPDGKTVVAGSSDRTAALWDLERGARTRAFEGLGDRFHPVAVRGTTLACGDGSAVVLFDLATGRRLFDVPGHTDALGGAAFLPDGRAVTAGADGHVALWDPETGRRTALWDTGALEFGTLAVDGSRRKAIVGGWRSPSAILDLETGARAPLGDISARAAAFAPDGLSAITGLLDGRLQLWDARTGALLRDLQGTASRSVAIRADGRLALVPAGEKSAALIDLATGRQVRALEGHARQVASGAFAPEGTLAVTGGADRTIIVWDSETGDLLKRIDAGSNVTSVTFGPRGLVASGHGDGSIAVWETGTGRKVRAFRGHEGPIFSVAFDGPGRRLISGSTDTTAIVWRIEP